MATGQFDLASSLLPSEVALLAIKSNRHTRLLESTPGLPHNPLYFLPSIFLGWCCDLVILNEAILL